MEVMQRSTIASGWRGVVAAVLAVAALLGCGNREGKPREIVTLQISETGRYSIEGRSVEQAELMDQLKAIQSTPGSIELHIGAHPKASHEAIGRATAAARNAGIGEIKFITAAPPP